MRAEDRCPTAAQIAASVRAGQVEPDAFVVQALRNIAETDTVLKAWSYVDRTAAEAARTVDRSKPLAGVPFGVKDIIEVRGMPTRYGVDMPRSEDAVADAWCVAAVRNAGAVPIGKTESTGFAFSNHPAPTYNPWNLDRTPGGSSAGSGAAVAAGTVPFAFGTQTGGSVLRPASYNGVVGFKPTFGRIPTTGVAALSPSVDTVGILASSVADMELLLGIIDPSFEPDERQGALTLLCDVTFQSAITSEDARTVLQRVATTLGDAGVQVRFESLPQAIDELNELYPVITGFEAYATIGPIVAVTPGQPLLHKRVESGAGISRAAYEAAFRKREDVRRLIDRTLEGIDGFLILTTGPTPTRETTGNHENHLTRPWTMLGNPTIAVPGGLDADGLPVGVQLIGSRGGDAKLLNLARRAELVAGFVARPPALTAQTTKRS